ncbi:MAG: cytochrome b/b6 domain-containing protein [Candidatus Hydrothermarchaeales archaeon]
MAEEDIQRFTTWQIIQHALWALAFTTLLVTGLALKFPGNSISQAVMGVLGMGLRATLHRLAALIFLALGTAHIVYYLVIDRGPKPIMFNRKDLSDIVQDVKYHLRMTKEEPKYGRYTWVEKFDYWAGAAGSFIIGITGIALWTSYAGPAGFGVTLLGGLPFQIYNWFRQIHGWEAILAGSVIVLLHLYMTVWRPGTFPLAKQIWTGKMSRHHYEEEHPLELEEIESTGAAAGSE